MYTTVFKSLPSAVLLSHMPPKKIVINYTSSGTGEVPYYAGYFVQGLEKRGQTVRNFDGQVKTIKDIRDHAPEWCDARSR